MSSDPDASMRVMKPRHGPMITWRWSDGRGTVTPTEHEEMKRAIEEAEDRFDPAILDSGTVVGRVWMKDDETIQRVEWADDNDPDGEGD